jgi:hypothetical protein
VCWASEHVKHPGVCGLTLLSPHNLVKHEKEERRRRDTRCTHHGVDFGGREVRKKKMVLIEFLFRYEGGSSWSF